MRRLRYAVHRNDQIMAVCLIFKSLPTLVHFFKLLDVFLAQSISLANLCVRILQY